MAGNDWLPPLPNATPILTSGTDKNEYSRAFPSKTGITRSCKKGKRKLVLTLILLTKQIENGANYTCTYISLDMETVYDDTGSSI